MTGQVITRWFTQTGALRRRGTVVAPTPVPSGFPLFDWTNGSVKPLGRYDTAEGPANVGCRIPLAQLERHTGNLVIPSGTVTGLDIFGNVSFSGLGVLRDCNVRGNVAALGIPGGAANRLVEPLAGVPGGSAGVVSGTSLNLRGSLIDHCSLDALNYESAFQDGLRGGNYTAKYIEIHGTVDGGGMVIVGNGKIYGSRISHSYYTAYLNSATNAARAGFPGQSDRTTHSDGIQIQQATGWEIIGNNIGGARSSAAGTAQANRDPGIPAQLSVIQAIDAAADYPNSGIIINTVGASNPVGALIDRNWLQGGAATINISAKSTDRMAAVSVTNNRFIRPSNGYQIFESDQSLATVTGNVWDDTGLPVSIVTFVIGA